MKQHQESKGLVATPVIGAIRYFTESLGFSSQVNETVEIARPRPRVSKAFHAALAFLVLHLPTRLRTAESPIGFVSNSQPLSTEAVVRLSLLSAQHSPHACWPWNFHPGCAYPEVTRWCDITLETNGEDSIR